jgi:hypothetical protein
MGHFCKLCGCSRANEAFHGNGHRTHICKDCKRMPVEKRNVIEQEDEIVGFLKQSHISSRNIKRLELLKTSPDPQIAELAVVALDVATIYPYKRRRLKNLARQRRDLLLKLEEAGLIYAHHF